ncbi:MAG TPA: thermonuclease family protein [Ilumatobacter sp.]|nr:thermonuclease family protein [Ilumatobacter sp.]
MTLHSGRTAPWKALRRASPLLFAAATSAGCQRGDSDGSTTATSPGTAVVDHHVDGDTIDLNINGREERVRLTGINTPEVAHDGTPQRPGNDAECFGDAAARFVAQLLPVGTEVRLERDVVARDDYGRLLAYVYRASDGLFVNEAIVRQGFAQPMTIPPNVAHADTFVEAARAAESADIGLWTTCR